MFSRGRRCGYGIGETSERHLNTVVHVLQPHPSQVQVLSVRDRGTRPCRRARGQRSCSFLLAPACSESHQPWGMATTRGWIRSLSCTLSLSGPRMVSTQAGSPAAKPSDASTMPAGRASFVSTTEADRGTFPGPNAGVAMAKALTRPAAMSPTILATRAYQGIQQGGRLE